MIYGHPLRQALPDVLERHWVGQAILATNASLSGPGGAAEAVMTILAGAGETLVAGLRRSAPRADVIRLAGTLRGRGTEGLLALGGGSVIDAAKAARLCLTNNVGSPEKITRLRTVTTAASPRPCLIAIPTTLSGAAYTPVAQVLDEATGLTDRFAHKDLAPDVVLLDPAITLRTPPQLWFASGIVALGQAIDSWCSPMATPYADACTVYGAQLLVDGLLACHRDPGDLDARLRCQLGARFAMQGLATGVPAGATRFALAAGPAAACVMLPHALRLQPAADAAKQATMISVLPGTGALEDRVSTLMDRLDLPRRLRDVGVAASALPGIIATAIATDSLRADRHAAAATHDVEALFRLAW